MKGSRIHIYRWLNAAKAFKDADAKERESLPKVELVKDGVEKIKPGTLLLEYVRGKSL